MTTPNIYLLNIYRGDSIAWQFVMWNDFAKTSPVDLTGVTPKAQIRTKPGGPLIVAIPCEITLPNIIEATLDATTSGSLAAGTAAWDLQLTTGNGVSTVLVGPVVVTGDVTDSLP